MELIENFLTFISSKTPYELFYLLWYFLIFDFTRYVLTDIFFLFYFIFFSRRDKRRRENARKMLFNEFPLVTVIAPGKNEGKHLEKLVNSLSIQTYKNLEIIIIDDGSDDDTAEIGLSLERQKKIDLFLSNKTRGGKASAANLALRYANGKFIVHLDADTSMNMDAVENIIMPFYMNSNIGAVAGDIRVRNLDESFATTMQGFEYIKNISLSRVINSKLNILRIVSGAFGAFRKDVLDRIGGWDIGPGLDGDITVKIRKLKMRIWFEESAVCYTNVPDTFRKLAKQRYRWSRSLVRFRIRKHADTFSLFSKGFHIFNFLSFCENLFFNFVLNIKWWLYIGFIFLFEYDEARSLILLNYILYFLANVVQFIICLIVLNKTLKFREKLLILYTPLVPIYTGIFLRTVRTFAYLMELLFKMSYEDKWNPWKVSKHAKEEHF